MALDSPKDLFLYELSVMHDGEQKILRMLEEVSQKVNDDSVADTLRQHLEETWQQIQNLERCFEELGASPQGVNCSPVEAIHQDYKTFLEQQPAPDVLTMFILGGAAKTEYFEIASYRALMGQAMLMDKPRVIQALKSNLVQEESAASKVERFSHELGQRVLARA